VILELFFVSLAKLKLRDHVLYSETRGVLDIQECEGISNHGAPAGFKLAGVFDVASFPSMVSRALSIPMKFAEYSSQVSGMIGFLFDPSSSIRGSCWQPQRKKKEENARDGRAIRAKDLATRVVQASELLA